MESDARTVESAIDATFPIVGIGTSGGDLDACQNLLGHLPKDARLAVVVVQHLEATQASELPELLAKATPMRVVSASDGAHVLPGYVYVMPPNVDLLIRNGTLRVEPRARSPGLPLSIDRFFQSLAVDQTSRAVGVLLSDASSDGTLGLRAIQAAGGLTFAQDCTAEHDAMPNSAILAGCADFVRSPDGIARELANISSRGLLADGAGRTDTEQDLLRVLAALRKATGVDFAEYKHTQRRLLRRIQLNQCESLKEYADLVEQEPTEAAALGEDMLIHVTSFFRDAEVFDALKTQVFPRLVSHRASGAPIRVWVPGCSTGEEVYSIAIALLEFLSDVGADHPVKLFGTDLSETALEKARAAAYPESIAREVSPGRLQRFFVKAGTGYRIEQGIRDMCIFASHDVTRDPPFSNIDLVSCRNLLIYLGPALQSRVLPIFHYALTESGFLLLGAAENIGLHAGFTVVDGKHRIFGRSPLPSREGVDFAIRHPAVAGRRSVARPGPHATTQLEIQREADRAILSEYAPPGIVVTEDLVIVQFRGHTGAYLDPASGVATFDLLRMARDEMRLELRRAFDEARKTGKALRRRIELERGPIHVRIVPFKTAALQQTLYAVLFEEEPAPSASSATGAAAQEGEGDVERQLRDELAQTRSYLQSVIEQLEAGNEELKAANEEVVSSNEELQSTNEELQTAKEEAQAANEELTTVNREMMERNREAMRLNDDLTNVLTSVSLPIVLLGRDGRIRRFTPAAGKLLRLLPTNLAHPLGDVTPTLDVPDLTAIVANVLEHLTPMERNVRDTSGRWYSLTVRPYMTVDKRIDGAVVVLVDIDALKKGEQAIAAARDYAERIVDTLREGLLVLDERLEVRSANRSFCRHFRLSPEDVVGRPLARVGAGQWGDPALFAALERARGGATLDGLRLERDFPSLGRRVLLLNARRLEEVGAPYASSLLLAIDDVTEAVRTEETALRAMLSASAEPIVTTDAAGIIVFANRAAHAVYGYGPGELVGAPIEILVPERLRERHAAHRSEFLGALTARPMGRAGMSLVGRRKDGSEFPVEVALTPLQGVAGPIVVAFLSDISARKAGERRILEYQEKLRSMAFDAALLEDRERRRIAANLHDGVGQPLALAQNKIASARSSVGGELRATLEECVQLVQEAIARTRSLTFDLSPPILYDLGLEPALRWLAEQIEKRYGIRVEFAGDTELKVGPEAAAIVFRSVRELLTNVSKHAGVSTAQVTLAQSSDGVSVVVDDPGVGFDSKDKGGAGFGLFSVREQIERLGGSMDVHSALQKGTRVTLVVPSSRRPSGREPSP
jgi:two-component system CheB/CheR fusion protein